MQSKLPININAKLVKIENKAHFIEFNIQIMEWVQKKIKKIFDKFVNWKKRNRLSNRFRFVYCKTG
jgi:hypothetical protein